jgi:hypothetical protein
VTGRRVSGDVGCTGELAGTGTFEANFESDTHVTQKITMQRASTPGTMTIDIDGTYAGPNCGSVKPVEP